MHIDGILSNKPPIRFHALEEARFPLALINAVCISHTLNHSPSMIIAQVGERSRQGHERLTGRAIVLIRETLSHQGVPEALIRRINSVLFSALIAHKGLSESATRVNYIEALLDLEEKRALLELLAEEDDLWLADHLQEIKIKTIPVEHLLFILKRVTDEKRRHTLQLAMVKRSADLAFYLISHIKSCGLHRLNRDHRYDLTIAIAEKLIKSYSRSQLAENLEELHPEEWSLEQRQKVANILSRLTNSASLAKAFHLLRFSPTELIETISWILEEFLRTETSPNDREDFCKTITMNQLDLAAAPLEKRITLLRLILVDSSLDRRDPKEPACWTMIDCKHFGFIEAIAKTDSLEERVTLATTIVNLCQGAAVECANHFDELGVKEAPMRVRLELLQSIIKWGRRATLSLARNFSKICIVDATSEEKITLLQAIMSHEENEGGYDNDFTKFLRNFQQFKLDDANDEQILALASFVAARDLSSGLFIAAQRISLQSIKEATTIEEAIEAAKKLAKTSDIAAAMIANSFYLLKLIRASIKERVDLISFLLERGPLAAFAVVSHYLDLPLSEASGEQLADHFFAIARKDDRTVRKFIEQQLLSLRMMGKKISFDDRLGIIRALSPPIDCDTSYLLYSFWDVKDFQPLVTVEERFALAIQLAQLSPWGAERLANDFDQLKLHEATATKRAELTLLLLTQRGLEGLMGYESVAKQRSIPMVQLYQEFLHVVPLDSADQANKITPLLERLEGGWLPLLFLKVSQQTMRREEFFNELKKEPKLQKISELLEQQLMKTLAKVRDDPQRKSQIELQLLSWSAYATTIIYDMTMEEIEALLASHLLIRIMELRSPTLRYPVMRQLSFLITEEPSLVAQKADDGQATRAASWIVTARLPSLGIPKRLSDEFFHHICKQSVFKETKRTEELLSFFLTLLSSLSSRPKEGREVDLLAAMVKKMTSDARRISNQLQGKKKPPNLVPNQLSFEELQRVKVSGFIDRKLTCIELIQANLQSTNRENFHAAVTPQNLVSWVPDELKRERHQLFNDRLPLLHNLLILFGRTAFYDGLASKDEPQDYFSAKFVELFQATKEVQDLSSKFQHTFGKFRDKKAIYTYFRNLKGVHHPDKALDAFNRYVVSVLEGRFFAMRYGVEDHPHLARLFREDGVREQWLMKADAHPIDLSKSRMDKPEGQPFKSFFVQKILIDHHLNLAHHPFLHAFLKGEEGTHFNDLSKKIESLRMVQRLEENQEKKRTLRYRLQSMTLEQEIIRLSSAKLHEQTTAFDHFLKKIEGMNLGELQNDINQLKNQLHPSPKLTQLFIEESDDPCDLLLLGTEIHGSCQRVDGSPDLNKGLLGYLLHGEIRPIVVKDGSGTMVARSIMRLLWDGKRPVIVLERIYDNMHHQTIQEAIQRWAIEKATRMAIPLLSREVGAGPPYPEEVQFLGGRAPFIYSDSLGGVLRGDLMIKQGGFHSLAP